VIAYVVKIFSGILPEFPLDHRSIFTHSGLIHDRDQVRKAVVADRPTFRLLIFASWPEKLGVAE
jgi:hypothetical protein